MGVAEGGIVRRDLVCGGSHSTVDPFSAKARERERTVLVGSNAFSAGLARFDPAIPSTRRERIHRDGRHAGFDRRRASEEAARSRPSSGNAAPRGLFRRRIGRVLTSGRDARYRGTRGARAVVFGASSRRATSRPRSVAGALPRRLDTRGSSGRPGDRVQGRGRIAAKRPSLTSVGDVRRRGFRRGGRRSRGPPDADSVVFRQGPTAPFAGRIRQRPRRGSPGLRGSAGGQKRAELADAPPRDLVLRRGRATRIRVTAVGSRPGLHVYARRDRPQGRAERWSRDPRPAAPSRRGAAYRVRVRSSGFHEASTSENRASDFPARRFGS